MKIIDSNLIYLSKHHSEKMDAFLEEEKSQTLNRQNRLNVRMPVRQSSGNNPSPTQMVVDRVSFSRTKNESYQTNYSADTSSRSLVTSIQSGAEPVEFEQKTAVEKIVGGIIDKAVVLKEIELNAPSDSPGKDVKAGRDLNLQALQGRIQTNATKLAIKKTDIHFEEENMQFDSMGSVRTEDGREIDFSLSIELNRSFLSRREEEAVMRKWQEVVDMRDPLVISFDGKAPRLTDATFEFDLENDGFMESISFVSPGSGFLALDKNGDDEINNGSELFGPGTGNGFADLAAYDIDQNRWIDENDAVFEQLSVWTKDEDGKDHLISLKDAGIGAIALDYADTAFKMAADNNGVKGQLRRSGVFLFEDGHVGSIHQVDLAKQFGSSRIRDGIGLNTSLESRRVDPAQLAVGTPREGVVLIPGSTTLSIQGPAVAAQEPIKNPLEEMMEQIKRIREEIQEMLKKQEAGLQRSRGSSHRGVNRSGRSLATSNHNFLDTSTFLFRGMGPSKRGIVRRV